MKALVGAFNQEKALVGAFSVIVQPVVEPRDHFTALILRMPYFDDWILGRINNTRTVTMLARAEAGSALLGLVIMDIVSASEAAAAEGAEAEAVLPRFRSCPERLATIFTFLDWVKRDLELGAEVEEDDIIMRMMIT